MKTCSTISFPSKVRFRKKVHSQASDHVWFFLNLFSKRPREKKKKRKKEKEKRKKEKKKKKKKRKKRRGQFRLGAPDWVARARTPRPVFLARVQ